jgi:hypothetical protein
MRAHSLSMMALETHHPQNKTELSPFWPDVNGVATSIHVCPSGYFMSGYSESQNLAFCTHMFGERSANLCPYV